MKDNSLANDIPYGYLLGNGMVDLRGRGELVGYSFAGPSPDIDDAFELAERSRQLAAAAVHLGTGDTLYALWHRVPAPEPTTHEFSHRAAALVDADRRAQYANEDHWLTPSRLYTGHQRQTLVRTMLEAILSAADMPERQRQHQLAREYTMQRFAAFEDAVSAAVNLRRMNDEELFNSLLMDVTYLEHPMQLPERNVKLHQVIGACERQINDKTPMMGPYHLRVISIVLYPGVTFPQVLAVILKQKGRLTVSARFHCLDTDDARRNLEDEKRYWNRTGFESLQKLLAKWNLSNPEVDAHANEMKADINAALAEAARGTMFGLLPGKAMSPNSH
jgi:type IV secretion system protein TrbE